MPSSTVLRKLKKFFRPGYLMRVWLFTLFVSPLVFDAALIIAHSAPWSDIVRSLRIVVFLIAFGTLLLFPALLLYWLVWWLLKYAPYSTGVKKGLLSIVGTFGIWLLYFLFDQAFFAQGGFGVYVWPVSYSVVLTGATFFYTMAAGTADDGGKKTSTKPGTPKKTRNKKA